MHSYNSFYPSFFSSLSGITVEKNWEEVFEYFYQNPCRMMVLGGTDTGKSTFIRWVVKRLKERVNGGVDKKSKENNSGGDINIVNMDVGQPDFPPPSVVSLYSLKNDDIHFHFAGSCTPVGHLLQCISGLSGILSRLGKGKNSYTLFNTTGWIDGPDAVFYKQTKIDMIKPHIMVFFQRDRELMAFSNPYRRCKNIKQFFLQPSPAVKERTREERGERRQALFDEYFRNCPMLALDIKKMGISGIGYNFSAHQVVGQIVVLMDENLEHQALAHITGFDAKNKILEVETPLESNISLIKRVHFEYFYRIPPFPSDADSPS